MAAAEKFEGSQGAAAPEELPALLADIAGSVRSLSGSVKKAGGAGNPSERFGQVLPAVRRACWLLQKVAASRAAIAKEGGK